MRTLPRLVIFCLSALPILVSAQTPGTGAYPFSTLENKGFDSINPGNLNTHFAIPIVSKAGRGLGFNYTLVYDGLIWSPTTSGTITTWVPDPSWGFHGQLNGAGPIGYMTYNQIAGTCYGPHSSVIHYDAGSNNYVYYDSNGGNHAFNFSVYKVCPVDSNGNSVNTPPQTSGDGSSQDDSGLTLHGSVNGGGSVYSRDGSSITPPSVPGGAGSQFDTNGNYISSNGSGVFTDTLGVAELTVTGAGTPTRSRAFTYPVTLQQNGSSSASVVASYQQYTVQTHFQCGGVGESGAQLVSLVKTITLPDSPSDVYTFTYEATPGVSGAITGRLASITLPTGGTISYAYTGGCNGTGINSDGTTSGLTRTTSDGSRSYTRAAVNANATTTTLTDEAGNTFIYHFTIANGSALFLETHRQVWQGNTSGPNLLDQYTCYNGASASCDGQAIALPVSSTLTVTSYNGQSQSFVNNSYGSTGLLTQSTQSSASQALASLTNSYNSMARILSTTTADGSGNIASSNTFGYDETGGTPTSGLPQHFASGGPHGNLTSSHVMMSPGNTLDTTYVNDDAGQLKSQTATVGSSFSAATSYAYDSTDTFQTTTNLPTPSSGVSLSTSASFDPSSGALVSTTGLNAGQTVTVQQYDSLLRPTALALPNGSQLSYIYNLTFNAVSQTMGTAANANTSTQLDAYGRTSRVAVYNGQSSDNWFQVDYCYGPTGQLAFQPVPYRSTGFLQPNGSPTLKQCSGPGDTFSYDALGRQTGVTHADGSTTTFTYFSRAVKKVDTPGTTKILQYDLLGQLSAVCEISSNGSMPGSGAPAACGGEMGGTGFLTSYAYDLANHKVTVSQGAQSRIFQTDAAGRTISTIEPERGLTSYSYSYNSTGLVATRVRPRVNQTNPSITTHTTTQYDKVGRATSVAYDDGTSTKTFYYDQLPNHDVIANGGATIGQMTAMVNGVHAKQLAYDIMGRISQTVECLPDWCSAGTSQDPYRWYSYD